MAHTPEAFEPFMDDARLLRAHATHLSTLSGASRDEGSAPDAAPFTRDNIDFLQLVAGQVDSLRMGPEKAGELRRIAARIASILPP